MEDDFLLEDEDVVDMGQFIDDDEDDVEEEGFVDEDEIDESDAEAEKLEKAEEKGTITELEKRMILNYDLIQKASKDNTKYSTSNGINFPIGVYETVRLVLDSNPSNTSQRFVGNQIRECFHQQGHNRLPATLYTSNEPLLSDDQMDEFNEEYTQLARKQVAAFIKYLADRDLSRDSILSRRQKQRHIPAFLIFLFSSGMYDLIIDCPTLPEEYARQVKSMFWRIQKEKQKAIDGLAERYDRVGRPEVAERVRKMGANWFDKEPADILVSRAYQDLNLTVNDVLIYKEFRPRYLNASKSLTQDLVSNHIEVIVDPTKVGEKLKDKTRGAAIAEVKQLFKDWSKDNPINSELADKIVWNKLNSN